jgi:hypothetical protein
VTTRPRIVVGIDGTSRGEDVRPAGTVPAGVTGMPARVRRLAESDA